MRIIESRWRERQSRYENGIFFGTDDFIKLRGTPGEGYRADERTSITTLLTTVPDGWIALYDVCSVEMDDFRFIGGSTSWEEEGFVAVEQRSTGHLLWVLKLEEVEEFTNLSFDGSLIHAISEEYPFRLTWQIPVRSPENLTVNRSRAQ